MKAPLKNNFQKTFKNEIKVYKEKLKKIGTKLEEIDREFNQEEEPYVELDGIYAIERMYIQKNTGEWEKMRGNQVDFIFSDSPKTKITIFEKYIIVDYIPKRRVLCSTQYWIFCYLIKEYFKNNKITAFN